MGRKKKSSQKRDARGYFQGGKTQQASSSSSSSKTTSVSDKTHSEIQNLLGQLKDGNNKIVPSARARDYCYDPNDKLTFKGDLIDPKDCERFKQMFPCVGPNMLTGPHTDACLQSLWKKSGCTGDLTTRVTDQNDYKNWNSNSYGAAKNNMRESIRKVAQSGTDYTKVDLLIKSVMVKM